MTSILKAENITKTFINHRALSEVNVEIPQGSVFGLLGPNGAGKTTLIRIINQITYPDSGTVYFQGNQLRRKHVAQIGYLPEERGLYKKMKVGEQAVYLARLKGLSRHDALKRLKYWFEKFEIEAWWDKKVEELSKGMAQKIQFIVTIIHEPALLIFDEPFSGFDPINANLLKSEILALRDKGTTIIFSTHNMGSVEEICDRIALINRSEKILEGEIDEVRKRFRTFNFEVQYTGDKVIKNVLNDSFQLLKDEQENGSNVAQIRIGKEFSPNELLNNLIPHVTVQGLREIIPSMNDIFIEVVNQQNQSSIKTQDHE